MSVGKLLQNVANRPFFYMAVILSSLMVIGGTYLASPWYEGTAVQATTDIGDYLLDSRVLYSIAYASSGLVTLYGLFRNKPNIASRGLFAIFLFLLFTAISVLVVTGLRPLTWLSTLAFALFAAILRIHLVAGNRDG